MNRFAVIPTHNRPEELRDVIWDISPQVDLVYVIDNGSSPPVQKDPFPNSSGWIILRDSEQPPNLSRLWNVGMDQVAMLAGGDHKVAILNDDVRVPEGWFAAVSEAMDRTGAAAGCSSPWPGLTQELFKTAPDTDLMNRMYGPAFMLRGEAHLRVDERLRWWWGDTDLDWKARNAGGLVVVPGLVVTNLHENQSTRGVLAEQAGRDRETFREIWGTLPW